MGLLFFSARRETWRERADREKQAAEYLARRDAEERALFEAQPDTVKDSYRRAKNFMLWCIPPWTALACFSVWAALASAAACGLYAALRLKGSGFPAAVPLIVMLTGTALGALLARPFILEVIYGR
jgi:hypothetical protein